MSVSIRAPRASELRKLAAIEDSGLAQFVEHLAEDRMVAALASPAPTGSHRASVPGFLLVAGKPVVGFVHVLVLDGHAHLEQVSVLPDHARQGIGTALVRAAVHVAERDGFRALSLCTYRDVPWNGPFYAGLGFTEVEPADQLPFQRRLRDHEVSLGLDDVGPRVVMSTSLEPTRPRPDGVRQEPEPVDPFVVRPLPPLQPRPDPDVTDE